jgi:DNA-binding beta-propeller fold protein YncE
VSSLRFRRKHLGPLVGLALAGLVACGGGREAPADPPYDGVAYPVRPPAALPRPPWALVTNNGSDTLTLIDLGARRAAGSPPVGIYPVEADGPHHVAFDRARGQVFVALTYPRPTGAVGSHASHAGGSPFGKVARLGLPNFDLLGAVSVGPSPGDLALGADGARLVVTHFDLEAARAPDPAARNGDVYVFEGAPSLDPSISPRIVRPCVAPHAVALPGPAASRAWLACYGDDRVVALDLDRPDAPVVTSLDLGPAPATPGAPRFGPYASALAPGGARLLVGTIETERVLVEVDLAAASLRTVWRSEGAVFYPAYAPDGAVAFVPTQAPDRVVKLDLASGAVLAERTFLPGECERPHEVAFVASLGEPWVLCEGDRKGPGAALALDPATLATRAAVATGAYPDRLVVVEP